MPQFPASARSNLKLVLARMDRERIVVLDITDFAHPKTVSTGTILEGAKFASPTELSFVDYLSVDDPLVRSHFSGAPRTVVISCLPSRFFELSPDGTAVVYVTQPSFDSDIPDMTLHLVRNGQDRVIDTMPGLPLIFCAAPPCGSEADFRLLYSPDGAFFSLVKHLGSGTDVFRIWSSDGTLRTKIDSGLTTMSVWSGKSLYFRNANGIQVWRDGAISSFLPGVKWIQPRASPGGGEIVYQVEDSAGLQDVYVVNTNSGKVGELAKARTQAAFLSPRYVWYWRPPGYACPVLPCSPGSVGAHEYFVYDLQDETETESEIKGVIDVWPHPA